MLEDLVATQNDSFGFQALAHKATQEGSRVGRGHKQQYGNKQTGRKFTIRPAMLLYLPVS